MSYQRIGRTIDLTDVTAARGADAAMQLSYSTLLTFHHVIVEAAPSGTDDWTTLPDLTAARPRPRRRRARPTLLTTPPVPAPLPDAGPTVRPHGHQRVVERVHRRVGRLAQRRLRPVALRRPAGRREGQLRHRHHRGRRRRHRRVRRRHPGHDDRRGPRGRRVRGRHQRLDRRGPAARQPTGRRQQLRDLDRADRRGRLGQPPTTRCCSASASSPSPRRPNGPTSSAAPSSTCCGEVRRDDRQRQGAHRQHARAIGPVALHSGWARGLRPIHVADQHARISRRQT